MDISVLVTCRSRCMIAAIAACLFGGSGNTAAESDTSRDLKFNPGHYIAMNDWEGQEAMIEAIDHEGVRGVLERYPWAELEPSIDVYDFSRIESDLRLMARHGMQLVVRIEDKSFEPDVKPTPSYLWNEYTVPHGNWRGGYIAKRWEPWVTDRLVALIRALGERFDDHPNFEGVTFEESATSFNAAMQAAYDYSPERYRDETIRLLKSAREHLPGSQIFWSMNFLEGNQAYIGEIAEAVAPLGIAMGGPDVLPDNDPLVRLTYPYYERYKDRMTLFASIQYTSYGHERAAGPHPTRYWTMDELFRFARDRLHADYVFWTQKRQARPPGSYDWTDALPVIEANPVFNRGRSAPDEAVSARR